MSRCQVCDTAAQRPAPHVAMTKEYWAILEKPLRHVARRCGYALAVHGSLGYDIDLIAAPWRDSAVGPEHLIEEIRKAAEAIIGICNVRSQDRAQPEKKPCGRLAWALYLVPDDPGFLGPYLDLSIFPPAKAEVPEREAT
jgi:hypothetical protein